MKNKLTTLLKALISFGLMGYLFYRYLSDPSDRAILLDTLGSMNYGYMFIALVLFILAVLSDAYKWQILLKAQNVPVPLKPLANLTFVGAFFNNFLPANVGGDVVRGVFLARYIERPANAAVSVIVNKVIGLIAFMFTAVLAAIIGVAMVTSGNSGELGGSDAMLVQNLTQVEIVAVLGTLVLVGSFTVILSQRVRAFIGRFFEWKILAPLAPLYHSISNAFGAYRYQYKALIQAFVVGLATPILTGLVDIFIVAGLNASLNPIYIFLFNPIIAVLLIVPISIGGLGTGSLLYVYFYGLVGVSEALAFALSLVKQGIIYLGSLPGGFLWLRRQGKAASVKAAQEGGPAGDI